MADIDLLGRHLLIPLGIAWLTLSRLIAWQTWILVLEKNLADIDSCLRLVGRHWLSSFMDSLADIGPLDSLADMDSRA